MTDTVYALFDDYRLAEKAVGVLLDHGLLEEDDIEMFSSDMEETYDLTKPDYHAGITTTTVADAEVGAAKGAGWGVLVGGFGALFALTVPGFGPVVGGGALATALAGTAGTAIGGAIVGAVTGFLNNQGLQEPIARSFEDAIESGGALVEMRLPSRKYTLLEAERILQEFHVVAIHSGHRFTAEIHQ